VAALDEIVEEIAPRLLRFCLGCCGDVATAEEAAQDGLAALVQRWRRHGPPDSPQAFAFTVARRRLGRAKFRQRFLAPLEVLSGRADAGPNPEQTTSGREELGKMLQALREISEIEREALLLVAAAELSLAEAAAVTGSTVGAVKMRVHRARRHLAQILGV
jgi:RNA polymerase sigma-70 factor (ECF subfamily)